MILDRFQMTDKAATVTGAGRGIGAATAVGLAEAGSSVTAKILEVDGSIESPSLLMGLPDP